MNSFSIIYPEEKATCSNLDKWLSETVKRLTLTIEELTEAKNRIQDLEKDVGSLKDRVGTLESENSELKSKLNQEINQEKQTTPSYADVAIGKAKRTVEQMNSINADEIELNERKDRERNIVVFGIEKSKSDKIEDKKEHDNKVVLDVLAKIGCEDIKPKNVIRLKSNKFPDRPGPIIVKFDNVKERNKVLGASKKLRDTQELSKTYITPDLTEAQRLLDFQLRVLRNEKNKSLDKNSEFYYGIWKNKIIKKYKNGKSQH